MVFLSQSTLFLDPGVFIANGNSFLQYFSNHLLKNEVLSAFTLPQVISCYFIQLQFTLTATILL